MSLAEKFDEFAKEAGKSGQRLFGFEDLQRAFYAGAEAALHEDVESDGETLAEIGRFKQAEIDHFRPK